MHTTPWSHSLLHSFEICEHQCFRTYVKRDIPWEATPERTAGNEAHRAFELRLSRQIRLPAMLQQHEPLAEPIDRFTGEKHFEWKLGMREDGSACEFWAGDVWGRGVLDVALVNGATAMILDWKTGKTREDPTELEVQAVLLKAAKPILTKIIGRYIWLKDGKLGVAHDLSDTAVKLAAIRQKMENFKRNMRTDTWQKHANVLCGWCSVKDCEFNRRKD